jgi:hypothetical protein
MIPAHQAQVKTAAELAVVTVANVASWGLQDSVAVASLILSICTTVWVLVQLARFLQKWIREDSVFSRKR